MDNPPPTDPPFPGLEARVAKLEATVEYIQRDIAEINHTLHRTEDVIGRLATMVERTDGILQATLPTLATKAELANLRAELMVEIAKRPTTATVVMVVAVLIAIAGLPYWPHWFGDLKTMLGARP